MTDLLQILAGVYAGGVVWGLVAGDARPFARVAHALLWPLGPLAFVLTVTLLVLVAPVALIGRR